MHTYAWLKKVRFFGGVGTLYVLSVMSIGYIMQAAVLPRPVANASTVQKVKKVERKPEFVLVSGKPVRILIPGHGIDLPVDEGFYNPADGSWTLSDTHLQYAMMTFLANNHSGNTFIYGHGTDAVLGKLNTTPPVIGSPVHLFTDNGHEFVYSFESVHNTTPEDTSILDYRGPPTLILQTCSGPFSEWRTMYKYNLNTVLR